MTTCNNQGVRFLRLMRVNWCRKLGRRAGCGGLWFFGVARYSGLDKMSLTQNAAEQPGVPHSSLEAQRMPDDRSCDAHEAMAVDAVWRSFAWLLECIKP